MIAAVSTAIFMFATLGLMISLATFLFWGGGAYWLGVWVVLICGASVMMAITDAPPPVREK